MLSEDAKLEIVQHPWALAQWLGRGKWAKTAHLELLSDRLAACARGEQTRLIVEMPPRHGKSEMVSHWFPVWILHRTPAHRVMLASYEADFAAEWGRKVRNELQEHQHNLRCKLSGDSTAADRWHTTAGGGMFTTGVGGPATGKGANVLIVDDPVKNAEEADSPLRRQRVWDWWTSTAYTRLEPGGAAIVVMTRWHEDDLAGRLIQQSQSGEGEHWDVIRLPAIAEDEDDALGRPVGAALWPGRYDEADMDRIRTSMPARWWNALYQQRPSAEDGEIFKRDWWRRYAQAPPKFDAVIQSWDCTFKDLKSSDFVVGQVWGRIGPDRYLLHQVRARMTFSQTLEAIRGLSAQYPEATGKLVEDKANGTAVLDVLRKELSGLIAVNPQGGKVARAWAVQPYVQAGNVWIPDAASGSWVDGFVEECASFPNAAHDDQVDAMTQALTHMAGSDYDGTAGARVDQTSVTMARTSAYGPSKSIIFRR